MHNFRKIDVDQGDVEAMGRIVAANIARYRKKARMTQRCAGDFLGVEKETISRIESGKIGVNIERLYQFSLLFDCSIYDLLYSVDNSTTKDKIDTIINTLNEMDDEMKDFAITLMGNIVNAVAGKAGIRA